MSETRPPPPELEKLPTAWLVRVGAAALTLLAAASVAAWALWVLWRPKTERPFPVPVSTPQIGMLDQPPFSLDRRADALKTRQRERLEGYGWVDVDAGVIHQPIDAAMRQLLSESEGGAR